MKTSLGNSVLFLAAAMLVAAFSLEGVVGFGLPSDRPTTSKCSTLSRSDFLQAMVMGSGVALVAGTSAVPPAYAKEDPALKGTKKDPAFENCLSSCMYECTKPKGTEQKSRSQCLPECKEKCATSKQQLMKGEPKPM